MGVRLAIAIVLAGCGRLNFDPLDDGGSGGGGDAGFTPTHEVYIKASNATASNAFGQSVALSADGSTLAVGTIYEASAATGIDGNQADTSDNGAGAVYVFVRAGASWVQQAYVKASNTALLYQFGVSLALSADGNVLAVGSLQESSDAIGIDGNQVDKSATSSGAAYVFRRTGGTWAQDAYVKASNTGQDDFFGLSIALSGDGSTLAVGAVDEASGATGIDGNQADNTVLDAGAVYVFTHATSWSQQAYIKASNTNSLDYFGNSVALSNDGSTLVVGAGGEASAATGIDGNQSDNSASNAGAAYVFVRGGSTWSQQAYVKASNTNAGDNFGDSLALSADGNTLAIAAPSEASSATGVNGDQTNNAAYRSGAAYVFTRAGTTWSQQAYVKASNAEAGDAFGVKLALAADGNTLAVGATSEASAATGLDGNQSDNSASTSGAAYVFSRAGTQWSQRDYVKATNTDMQDSFGFGVALAGNGSTLAVSAIGEASAARGIGGDQGDNSAPNAGAVYIYE